MEHAAEIGVIGKNWSQGFCCVFWCRGPLLCGHSLLLCTEDSAKSSMKSWVFESVFAGLHFFTHTHTHTAAQTVVRRK